MAKKGLCVKKSAQALSTARGMCSQLTQLDEQPPPISVDRMGGDLPPAYGNLGADDMIEGAVGEIGSGKTHGFTDPDVAAPEYGIA